MFEESRLLVCPGAQKAGTTWLHQVLKQHPQFWMPPQKELDYLFNFPPSREKYSEKLAPRLARARANSPHRAWLELFLRGWDLDLYPRLFNAAGEKFAADVSPNYSRMSSNEIARAAAIIPGAHVVILLREPVERAWSHARNTSKRWEIADPEILIERMTKFVHSKACDMMSDYPRLLADWRAHFGMGHVLICFYDDLVADAQAFVNEILTFVGAPEFPLDRIESLAIRPNVGADIAMPEQVRRSLDAHYRPMIARLGELIGNRPAPEWVARD